MMGYVQGVWAHIVKFGQHSMQDAYTRSQRLRRGEPQRRALPVRLRAQRRLRGSDYERGLIGLVASLLQHPCPKKVKKFRARVVVVVGNCAGPRPYGCRKSGRLLKRWPVSTLVRVRPYGKI